MVRGMTLSVLSTEEEESHYPLCYHHMHQLNSFRHLPTYQKTNIVACVCVGGGGGETSALIFARMIFQFNPSIACCERQHNVSAAEWDDGVTS
jgi:hypothetical protein